MFARALVFLVCLAAVPSERVHTSAQPQAAAPNVKELVDARFVTELEDAGFVASLSKN